MNAIGTNTATIEKVVAATARPISSVPSCEARKWSFPISMCRTMFSRTTIASSIRMPIASDRPSSDMVLSVKPNAHTAMNDGEHRDRQREAGDHRRAPRVEEEEDDEHGQQRALEERLLHVRHRSPHAIAGVLDDVHRRARRERGAHLLHGRRTSSLTCVVLYPFDFLIMMPTASCPL